MTGEIGLALQLVLELLKIIKPSDLQKVKDEIAKCEKEGKENEEAIIKALETGDVGAINILLNRLLAELRNEV